jgi:ubiquinone/menaquinone biosynthesis C-methylase UbiE
MFYISQNSKYKKNITSINKAIKLLPITQFNYQFLINEIVFLNLIVETILFDKSPKQKNPVTLFQNALLSMLSRIQHQYKFKNFDKKNNVKRATFIREKTHNVVFSKLWSNFTLDEYKKERLGRYNKRLRINNLKNFIKDKKIIDLGCGHGNFLISCLGFGAKKCVGIDYGKDTIQYAKKIAYKLKLQKKVKFYCRSIYHSKLRANYYDFAIQNGVFHHMDNEVKAYKEMYRVLKKGGHCWIYTDGGGGIRDNAWDMCQNILKNIDKNFIIDNIRSKGLTTNKEYHLGDGINALYRHTTLEIIKKKLSKIGFEFVKQLNGGFSTDFDKPFYKDKYFKEKFGSGDLRLLFRKI